jgi:hypothetical protein
MSSIDDAYRVYRKHIYDIERLKLLSELGLKVAGSVPSVMWEAFCAKLVERKGTGLIGADLEGWEVKSAKFGGSFEYQYHLNTGQDKLDDDCLVNHLFCSYSTEYENVIVMAMKGPGLADQFFRAWMPGYVENYCASSDPRTRRQRYRKSIPQSYVKNNGTLVLEIRDAEIIHRNDEIIPQLNSEI